MAKDIFASLFVRIKVRFIAQNEIIDVTHPDF